MNWNRECRYKVHGRLANSDRGLILVFDLEEAIMFEPKKEEYTDPATGKIKKRQVKYYPDYYKNRIGRSYNDYAAAEQRNLFEDMGTYEGAGQFEHDDSASAVMSDTTNSNSVHASASYEPDPNVHFQPERNEVMAYAK